jgi:hypothetical protein
LAALVFSAPAQAGRSLRQCRIRSNSSVVEGCLPYCSERRGGPRSGLACAHEMRDHWPPTSGRRCLSARWRSRPGGQVRIILVDPFGPVRPGPLRARRSAIERRQTGAANWPSKLNRAISRRSTVKSLCSTSSWPGTCLNGLNTPGATASISRRRYRIVWLGVPPLSAIQREAMHVPTAPRVISNGTTRAKLTSALHADGVSGR